MQTHHIPLPGGLKSFYWLVRLSLWCRRLRARSRDQRYPPRHKCYHGPTVEDRRHCWMRKTKNWETIKEGECWNVQVECTYKNLPYLQRGVIVGGTTTILDHLAKATDDILLLCWRRGIFFAHQHSDMTRWIRDSHDGTISRTDKSTILHVFPPWRNGRHIERHIERFSLFIVKQYKAQPHEVDVSRAIPLL